MGSSKQGGDIYSSIIKEGTHLAPSENTPDTVRGTQLRELVQDKADVNRESSAVSEVCGIV